MGMRHCSRLSSEAPQNSISDARFLAQQVAAPVREQPGEFAKLI